MPKNKYITLKEAREISKINKQTLNLLVKKGILDTKKKKKRKILVKRGISPLSIDEISELKQYLKCTKGTKRTEFYYFKDKLGDDEQINKRTTIDDLPVFLHRFDGCEEILISTRPIKNFPIISLRGRGGMRKKLTKKQILEAHVFRYFEEIKIKELADMYDVTEPTIRTKLNSYGNEKRKYIERCFKKIINEYKLPKNAKLLTTRETAARLNFSNMEIINLIKNGHIKYYETKMGKIPFYAIDYKQIEKLIGYEFLKERLLKGPEFITQMGWDIKHGWRKIKKFGIHYIPIIPIEEDELKNSQKVHRYHMLSRIPESQLEIAKKKKKKKHNLYRKLSLSTNLCHIIRSFSCVDNMLI